MEDTKTVKKRVSINKIQKDGNVLSAWLSKDRGISLGMSEERNVLIPPFLSIYPKSSGGYRIVLRKELLEKFNITIDEV